jgi:hypothetical protein
MRRIKLLIVLVVMLATGLGMMLVLRRTDTCSKPAFESISAALAERFSVRQMVISGSRLIWFSSRIFADSSAIGMLLAAAMWPSGPRNSSAVRTSIRTTCSPLASRLLRVAGSVKRRPSTRRTRRGRKATAARGSGSDRRQDGRMPLAEAPTCRADRVRGLDRREPSAPLEIHSPT